MIKIAVCGPRSSGRTTVANVFVDNGYLQYDFNDFRTGETNDPLPALKEELRKLNSKILLGLDLKGIVVHDIGLIEEIEYLATQGFEGLYIRTPSSEYIIKETGEYDMAVPGLYSKCRYHFENTDLLEKLIENTQNLITILETPNVDL